MPLPTLLKKLDDFLFTDALFTAFFTNHIDRTWFQPRVRSQTLR
jgi:hypothetical protein